MAKKKEVLLTEDAINALLDAIYKENQRVHEMKGSLELSLRLDEAEEALREALTA